MKRARKRVGTTFMVFLAMVAWGVFAAGGAEMIPLAGPGGDALSTDEHPLSATDGVKSVIADLSNRDDFRSALFEVDLAHRMLEPAYGFGDTISDAFGLNIGMDYVTLAQRASFTESGEKIGWSQVFRILGTWLQIGEPEGNMGTLVWKMETRNTLGGYPAPRDLGFDTGSVLSTANFKELNYWGITDLYWKQRFQGGKFGLLVGHMDPGDWADQYPLLNAWTSFMNDAFYNNPTEAIPKRGFGVVGQAYTDKGIYLMGGVHDANGGDGRLDPSSFWDPREWFSWAEVGHRGDFHVADRQNFHVHFWHQDPRRAAGVERSWGGVYTHSFVTNHHNVAFVRAGYSEGDAAQMRRFVGGGYSFKAFGRDTLGMATSWGSPPDKAVRSQVTSEFFYRLQVTQNLTVSPDVQLTYHPSFTTEKRWVFVPGLRMRMVF